MNKNYLRQLEKESIYIIRETYASFKNVVMLYSVGKDSSVMAHLARKAFMPNRVPFPFMHIDTGFKFPEMYDFRDKFCEKYNIKLIVESNQEWINKGCNPDTMGIDKCCLKLKTEALLEGIKKHNFDAAFGGARREEEKSRAKERVFSVRNKNGKWDPKQQRPELWNLYNTFLNEGETMRVFPLSNWTELDIWTYIKEENISVVPLYFSKKRKAIKKNNNVILSDDGEDILCRFRTLGCTWCTGAIESSATSIDDIIEEVKNAEKSERENRLIDNTSEHSMETKKGDGYF